MGAWRLARSALVFLVSGAALLVGAGEASAASSLVSGRDAYNDGNPDVQGYAAEWTDAGELRFALAVHRSALFTGEDVGDLIDTDCNGSYDYRLMLHQYGDGQGVRLMSATSGGWNFDTPNNTTGGYFENGQMFVWVHRSEVRSPTTKVCFVPFSVGGQYAGQVDYGYYTTLLAPGVAGANGPAAGGQAPVSRQSLLRAAKPTVRGRRVRVKTRVLAGAGTVRVTFKKGRHKVRAKGRRHGALYVHRARLTSRGRWKMSVTVSAAPGWKGATKTSFVRVR